MGLVRLAGVILLLALPAWAETAREIRVEGEGRVAAAPDMATIRLAVTQEAEAAAEAMRATSGAVAAILVALEEAGVAPRDMQTEGLNLSPVWSNRSASSEGRPRISGFVASNRLLIRVRDLDGLGGLLDEVLSLGANEFQGLQFGLSEPRPLLDAARREAVSDARAKAELFADAAGVTLGALIQLSEENRGGAPLMRMEMAEASIGGAVPVAEGEVAVTAQVSLVYAIAE